MKKLRFQLKWQLRFLLAKCKLYNPWKGKKGSLVCVVFHGVCKNYQAYINGRFVRDADLESFIRKLKKKAHFVTLKQVMENELDAQKLNVLLTFDDGYKNNLDLALPILSNYQVPAVICVTGQHEPLWMDALDLLQAFYPSKLKAVYERVGFKSNQAIKKHISQSHLNEMLTYTQHLRQLLSEVSLTADQRLFVELLSDESLHLLGEHPLIEIVNHGFHHAFSPNLNENELLAEFENVKQRLEHVRNAQGQVIALPFGKLNEQQAIFLNQKGYYKLLMMEGTFELESQLSRLTYNPFFSPSKNILVVANGSFD